MANNQKTIFVYDDFTEEKPILLGKLYVDSIKGGETYSFEYDNEWLKNTGMTANLDPDLMPYGVNPVPYGDELSLNVNEDDNRISIALAIDTAKQFGIQKNEAQLWANGMTSIIRENWEKLAVRYGISRGKIEDMRPAFTACYE